MGSDGAFSPDVRIRAKRDHAAKKTALTVTPRPQHRPKAQAIATLQGPWRLKPRRRTGLASHSPRYTSCLNTN